MELVKLEDFTRFQFLSGVKHSPDGEHICYVVHQSKLEENRYVSNLWIMNIKNKTQYKLTAFDGEQSFMWLDNENIMFMSLRDEQDKAKKALGEEFTQYYKINIHHGEGEKYIRIPKEVNTIKKLKDGMLIFTANTKIGGVDLNSLSETEKAEELESRKEEKDYEVLDEIPFWSNGEGFTNGRRNRLFLYDTALKEIKSITEESVNVEDFNVNIEGTEIVFISNRFVNKMKLTNELGIYSLEKNEYKQISRTDSLCHYYAGFLNQDTLIFTASEMKKFGLNENEEFYILNYRDEMYQPVKSKFDISLTNSVGSDSRYGDSALKQIYNGKLYFVSTEGNSSYLNVIDNKLNKKILSEVSGSVDGISINDELVIVGMRENKLQEIYRIDNGKEEQLTEHNAWTSTELKLSTPIPLSIAMKNGGSIEGYVIRPVDFDENKCYPAILDIHGGPKTVYGSVYYHEMQYFASRGYFVFYCNPRGSDGKGNEFADIRGKYGSIDYDDIMQFTDEVMKTYPQIDEGRLGVMGGSYGGYMTNWIIGHTNRFRAAVSQRSISNWISKFNTTDIGYFFVEDQVAATPWNNAQQLWDNSPLKYADKVSTPTLFIHSEEDYRCHFMEGLQMFTSLKYHGVETRLCMFRGENHELTRSGKPKHRIRNLVEISEWFSKYL